MSAADARRRDLQRRAFAPDGRLTPEEAEELRMLSQPARAGHDGRVPEPDPRSPDGRAPEPDPRTPETPTGAERPVEWGAGSEGSMSDIHDAPPRLAGARSVQATGSADQNAEVTASDPDRVRRHPRWLIPVVLLVALMVGLGVGWLVSQHPAHASPPAMNAAQQKAYDDLVATGGFEDGSLSFAGTKYGASVWTAAKGGDECIVMLLDGHRSTECADPKTGSYGNGMIGVQRETGEGDVHSSITAVLFTNITGERTVLVNRLRMTSGDDGWQGQYSPAELDLVHVLEQDGFTGSELMISGYDGNVPIWTTWGDAFCIAVVDPDTHDVTKSCTDPMIDAVIEIGFRDSTYSARFTESHGIAVSVTRAPSRVSRVSCDSDTGQCTSIDDTTGDIG